MKSTLEKNTFFTLLLLTSIGFVWILNPFFSPIFWASVVALLFHPLQKYLYFKFRRKPNLSALATLSIGLIIVVIPVTLLITAVIAEIRTLYLSFTENGDSIADYFERFSDTFPAAQGFIDNLGLDLDALQENIRDSLTTMGEFLAVHTISIGQNAVLFAINLGLMIYLSFFLLRDGRGIVRSLLLALPLSNHQKKLLTDKFSAVIRATIKGNFIIAAIEGTLGGLIFWALGIGNALLWGAAMVVVSLLPVIGAGFIWAPAAIYLFFTDEFIRGAILVLFGMIVIGLVDNFLRPILVGRDTKLPDYVVLFSTVGGLALMGIDGFVIGPLIAGLFVVLWQIFINEFDDSQG